MAPKPHDVLDNCPGPDHPPVSSSSSSSSTPSPLLPPPLSPVQPGQDPPVVPWQAETLVSLVDQLIEAAEENLKNALKQLEKLGLEMEVGTWGGDVSSSFFTYARHCFSPASRLHAAYCPGDGV
jgi:hypothetical protein